MLWNLKLKGILEPEYYFTSEKFHFQKSIDIIIFNLLKIIMCALGHGNVYWIHNKLVKLIFLGLY